VKIELRHQDERGPVEMLIDAAAANTGSYLWTVPAGVPSGSDYVISVTWDGDPSTTNDDIVGASRRHFSIGPDTLPPTVLDTTPRIVDREFQREP
jgi:hypothetical protein